MRAGDRASRKMPMLTVVAVCDGVTTARRLERGCVRRDYLITNLLSPTFATSGESKELT